MNRKLALSAIVLAASFAGSAFAETPTVVTEQFVSTKTRVEVLADLAAYKQAGVNPWSFAYNPLRSFHSTTSRDAVVADFLASRTEVTAMNAEDSGSSYLAQARDADLSTSTLAGQPRNGL
jgi:hypothetical protein